MTLKRQVAAAVAEGRLVIVSVSGAAQSQGVVSHINERARAPVTRLAILQRASDQRSRQSGAGQSPRAAAASTIQRPCLHHTALRPGQSSSPVTLIGTSIRSQACRFRD